MKLVQNIVEYMKFISIVMVYSVLVVPGSPAAHVKNI